MKRLGRIGMAVLLTLPFAGCVAVRVSQPTDAEMRIVAQSQSISPSEVTGVEPTLDGTGGTVNVSFSILGTFDVATTSVYAGSANVDRFVAVGFFPGVMSCRGEYRDCMSNAACACLYNIVFVGLPTVYGLLVEPWIPHYPEQTDSIVGQQAFLKSALIGVSRYAKRVEARERQKVSHSVSSKIKLEDAIVLAPELGLESERGKPLRIPIDRLPENGELQVKLKLPEAHPLKDVMAGFEDAEITVQFAKK